MKLGLHVEFSVLVIPLIGPLLVAMQIVSHRAQLSVGMPAGDGSFENAILVRGLESLLLAGPPFDVLAIALAVLVFGLLGLIAVEQPARFDTLLDSMVIVPFGFGLVAAAGRGAASGRVIFLPRPIEFVVLITVARLLGAVVEVSDLKAVLNRLIAADILHLGRFEELASDFVAVLNGPHVADREA